MDFFPNNLFSTAQQTALQALVAGGGNPRLAAIASRGLTCDASFAGAKQSMTRRAHIAFASMTAAQVIVANAGIQGSSPGFGSGSPATITASIEYPAGTFTRITFGGASSVTLANATITTSDSVAVTIPAGARFWTRTWCSNASGVLYSGLGYNPYIGDASAFGDPTTSDLTMGGTVAQQTGYVFCPVVAVLGTHKYPAVLLIGDSTVRGQSDQGSGGGYFGVTERSVGPAFASTNMGASGSQINNWANSGFLTGAFASIYQYFDVIVSAMGVNDVFIGGRTSAQMLADLATIRTALGSGKSYYHTTITPKTTSSDSWATVANQTTIAGESERLLFNAAIRLLISGVAGVFDISAPVEDVINGSKWAAPGVTVDGVHLATIGNSMVERGAGIRPEFIRRPI